MPPRVPRQPALANKLAQRRAHIVETASLLFIENGFHQTGMRDIAARSGISLGNLYNHFTGKDDIIAAIVDHQAAQLEPLLKPLEEAEQPVDDLLRAFVSDCFELNATPSHAALDAEIRAELFRNPVVASSLGEVRARLIRALQAGLPKVLGAADAELLLCLVERAGQSAAGKTGQEKARDLRALQAFVKRAVSR